MNNFYLSTFLFIFLISCSSTHNKTERIPANSNNEQILALWKSNFSNFFDVTKIHKVQGVLSHSDQSLSEQNINFPFMIIVYNPKVWDLNDVMKIIDEGSKILSQCPINFDPEKFIFVEVSQKKLFGDFFLHDLNHDLGNATRTTAENFGGNGLPFSFYFLDGTKTFNRNSGGATAYENSAVITPDHVFGDRISSITFAHEISHSLFSELTHRFQPGNILSEHAIRGTNINKAQCKRGLQQIKNMRDGFFRNQKAIKQACYVKYINGKGLIVSQDNQEEWSLLVDLDRPVVGYATGTEYLETKIVQLRKAELCE